MGQRLGEQLVAGGVIQEAQLQQALSMQVQLGGRLGTSLIETGALTEDPLLEALGRQRGSRTASRRQLENISAAVIRLLPAKLAKRYQLVPYELQGKTLLIASADVVDAITEDEIRMLTGHMVRTAVALELRVKLALQRYFRVPCGVRFGSLAKRLESGTIVASKPPAQAVSATSNDFAEEPRAKPPGFARQTALPSIPEMPAVSSPTSSPAAGPPSVADPSAADPSPAGPPRFARRTPPPPIPPLPQPVGESPASSEPAVPPSTRPLRTLEPISAYIPLPQLDENGRPRLAAIQSKGAKKPLFIELDDDDAELLRTMRETADPDAPEVDPAVEANDAATTGGVVPPDAPIRRPFWERGEAPEAASDATGEDADTVATAAPETGTSQSESSQSESSQSESAQSESSRADAPLAQVPTTRAPQNEVSTAEASSEVEDVPGNADPSEADLVPVADLPAEVPSPYMDEAFEPDDAAFFEEPRLDNPSLSIEERLDLASTHLQNVDIRDEIADVLLGFTGPYFERRLLLFRRQERILGWRGEGHGVVDGAVRAVEIERNEASVFLSLSEPSSFWMAPLPPLEPNQRLIAGLGGAAPKDCLVLPVVVRSKIVCYFYGDNRQDSVSTAPLAEIRRLMAKAGMAFEVYILKNKMRLL